MRKVVALVWVLLLVFGILGLIPETGASGTVDLSRGLVAYYSFDHCDARDDSGNGHDGEIYGNPKCVDGVIGKAFEFDGEDDVIKILGDNTPSPSEAITLSLWVKPFEVSTWQGLIWKEWCGPCYSLILTENGTVQAELSYDKIHWNTKTFGNKHLLKDNWYLITFTYDGHIERIYINGELDSETEYSNRIYADPNDPMAIGGWYRCTGDVWYYFKGLIDEVHIYNRALSEEEIKALYEQGVGGVSPQPTQPKTIEYLPPEDLSKWKYYREVVIKEQSGETLENFQVLIELNSNNFDFSKALPDGGDVRIVDESGNLLPYWIEEWNLTAKRAKIWTIVPRIPANGEVKLRLYYGNPNAQSRSDGDKVFEFFDDFDGNKINTLKWELPDSENVVIKNHSVVIPSGEVIVSTYQIHLPAVVEAKGSPLSREGSSQEGINLAERPSSKYSPRIYWFYVTKQWDLYVDADGNGDYEIQEDIYPNEMLKVHRTTLKITNNTLVYTEVINQQDIYTGSYNIDLNSDLLRLYLGTWEYEYYWTDPNGEIRFDYVFVRKYAPKDPLAVVGDELSTSGGALTTPADTQTSTPTQTPTSTQTQTTSTSTLAPIASSTINAAEDIISKIPSSIDVGDAKTMLDEAQKAYENQDYELARKFAETAQALAVKAYYDKLRTDLQMKENQGQDVGEAKGLLQQAYDAYQRKDYTETLEILSRADLVLQGVQPKDNSSLKYVVALFVVVGVALAGITYSRKQKGARERLRAEFDANLKSGDNIVERDQFGALEYYSKAFGIAKKLGDSGLIAQAQEKLSTVRGAVIAEVNSLISRGNEALTKSDYDKALAYYRQALSLAEKLNDEGKIREAKSKMEGVNKVRKIRELLSEGDVLMEGEKYSGALNKYEEALTIAREIGDGYLIELLKGRVSRASEVVEKTSSAVSSLIGQANRDMMEEDYESAIEKLSQALVLAEKVGTVSIEDIKAKLEEAKKRKELRDKLREAKSAKNYSEKLALLGEALTIAEGLGDERMVAQVRNEIEDVKKALVLETLKDGVSLILPKEIPYGRENTLSINVENRLNETIENLSIDLSELSPYFMLEEERIAFPPVKPGRKLGRDIKLKPQFKGDFDFNVRISSSLGETVKTLNVKVGDYYAPTQFTPKPLTPKAAPEELEVFYENFQYIGEGGFARVFKARRKKDGRVVAVKIPKTLDPATGKAFVREISNWLHLKHPNIVELYDVNVIPIPYLEMEYCEGSLAKLGKPMDVEQASYIVFNIAEGLKYAHSKGIIHRDLKPSNVLLKAGIPKISDWGLSKVMSESRSSTLSSFTPYYASPEQLSPRRFGHTDERTDIWQLGVLFYELVTGKLPFEGSDLGEVTFAIINEDPVKPSKLNPEAKLVEPIIMKMLAKRKEERYQSIEELQKDLAKVLNMTYVEGLKKNRDLKRTVFYIGDLALINLKAGNLGDALKYLLELREYAGKYKDDLNWLISQVKLAMEENIKLGEEAIMKADVIVHQIKMGG